jgi:hypothetical protein
VTVQTTSDVTPIDRGVQITDAAIIEAVGAVGAVGADGAVGAVGADGADGAVCIAEPAFRFYPVLSPGGAAP